jgi:biopolymer transport protein ExbD
MDSIPVYDAAPRKARIEIIPLIDVIFFLLATFVLFTLSLEKLKVIPVPLPRAAPPGGIDTALRIQATGEGMFTWQEGTDGALETIAREEIRPRLADYVRRVKEPRVLVRGDGAVKFGPAVMLLDEVREAGIKAVSVETRLGAAGN